MSLSFRLNLLLLVYTFVIRTNLAIGDEKPYEVIKFKVPHSVWKQALRPTPILKSPVTIVVPINVQGDYNPDEELEEDDAENIEVDATLIPDEVTPEVAPAIQDELVIVPANITNTEVLQDGIVPPPQQDVPGQVTRFPCSCLSGQCGCCTGAILERFRMKACGNMTFVPEDFVFDVRMSINNNTVIRQRVSASDPPPICFYPRRAPFVRVCAEISNIRIRNRNAHACLDINADIGGFPVYSASFKCFSLGTSGFKTGQKPKPVSSGPKPVSLFGNGGEQDGGFIQNAAETVINQGNGIFGGEGGILGGGDGGILGGGGDGGIFGGGGEGGIFGGGDGIFGDGGDEGGDEGPLDAIGNAFGDFLDGRSYS